MYSSYLLKLCLLGTGFCVRDVHLESPACMEAGSGNSRHKAQQDIMDLVGGSKFLVYDLVIDDTDDCHSCIIYYSITLGQYPLH